MSSHSARRLPFGDRASIEAGLERIVVVPGIHGPITGHLAESMRAMATDVLPALR